MLYIYLLAHTMGPFLASDGKMTEDWEKAMRFSDKAEASKYLETHTLYRTLYVQTLILHESKASKEDS